jgi:hypothetical protein
MKKIILSVLVAGSLLSSSCKEVKKGATDLKDATVETAGSAVDATTDAASKVADGAKDATKTVVDGAKDATNAVVDGAKDATNAVVDKATNMVSSALDGVSIPSFSNEAVTENLTEYAAYAKDYIATNGNLTKISAIAPKGAALLAKGKKLSASLNTEELTKYKSVLATIKSKMYPSK